MSPEEKLARKRALQLAWYHRTKHKKGISDQVVYQTDEERTSARNANARRRYRADVEANGRTVGDRKHEDRSEEARKQRQAEACARYRARNPEKRRESVNAYARRNRKKTTARWLDRYHSDEQFNLAIKIRRRIYMSLRKRYSGATKSDRVINLLGCSYAEFRSHIEKLFTAGMSWGACFNGEIHIDHKTPCSAFDLTDPEQQKACFHFTNLQPLWAPDNLKKGGMRRIKQKLDVKEIGV